MRLVDVGAIAASLPSGYVKGYPYAGPVEPNVVGQWVFNEASGNLIDQTASAFNLTPGGTPVYNQAGSNGITPGIDLSGGNFASASNPTALAAGTGDQTIEWWIKMALTSGDKDIWVTDTTNTVGMEAYVRQADHTLRIYTVGDATALTQIYTLTAAYLNDGLLHKYRLVLNRTTDLGTLYEDGLSVGTSDISSIHGKSISTANFRIGNAGIFYSPISMYDLRFSNNSSNNSGGPNGG